MAQVVCLRLSELQERSVLVSELQWSQSAYLLRKPGNVANPPPPPSGRRGRRAKTKAANLLGRLDLYADDVLRFATDFRVGFDNNKAERQVRMVNPAEDLRWVPDRSRCNRMAGGSQLPRHRDAERRQPARSAPASHGCRSVDATHRRQRLTLPVDATHCFSALALQPFQASGGEQ